MSLIDTVGKDAKAIASKIKKLLSSKTAQQVEKVILRFSAEVGFNDFAKKELAAFKAILVKTATGVLSDPANAKNAEAVFAAAMKEITAAFEEEVKGGVVHGSWLYILANVAWSEIRASGVLGTLL